MARHLVARVTQAAGRELLGTLVATDNVKPLRRVTAEIGKAMMWCGPGVWAAARRLPFEHSRPSGLRCCSAARHGSCSV